MNFNVSEATVRDWAKKNNWLLIYEVTAKDKVLTLGYLAPSGEETTFKFKNGEFFGYG